MTPDKGGLDEGGWGHPWLGQICFSSENRRESDVEEGGMVGDGKFSE